VPPRRREIAASAKQVELHGATRPGRAL
jgi:hypothetical protein